MSAPSLPHKHPCVICCLPTTMWCSRCRNAWYCSPDHHTRDWARHKKECIPFSCEPANQRNPVITLPEAGPIRVSALLFMALEEKAQVITVDCEIQMSRTACPAPLLGKYFPDSARPASIILTQGLNREPLRFPLEIWYCPTSLQRNWPINRAIYRITGGYASKAWCGPVVVLKFSGSRRRGYSNAAWNDLPPLSAYFLAYK
ncbi:hypothetical protein C8Q79DRAFT_997721 [Trametes meyenii]|nr:hypothetical protein C8Q79DRAFT_997721 [Trametes meyenii]